MTSAELVDAVVASIDALEVDGATVAVNRPANMADTLLRGSAVAVEWSWPVYPDLFAQATFYLAGHGLPRLVFFADMPRARGAYEAKLLGAWLTAIAGAVECLENIA